MAFCERPVARRREDRDVGKIPRPHRVGRSVNETGVQPNEVDVVVIGAGQAGLSSAYHLRRSGFEPERDFVVLDHAPRPGGAWQFRWPSLTYGKVHGMHALPGMELTSADPLRPSSEVIGEYFTAYERAFDLRVRRPVDVRAVREGEAGRLLVESSAGNWSTRALINATGTWDRPFWPRYPGQETFLGRQLHTAQYPGPEEFAWQEEQGITSFFAHDVRELGIEEVVGRTIGIVGEGPVFVSIDVDVLDPAFAPGTGTPEPGGLTSTELLWAARTVAAGLDVVGADVVEVLPTAIGSADVTALVAERIVRELMTGIALRRRSARE